MPQQNGHEFRTGVVENRKCNDVCCIATLVLFVLAFLGASIYAATSIDAKVIKEIQDLAEQEAKKNPEANETWGKMMQEMMWHLIGALFGGFMLSIGFIYLMSRHPTYVCYASICLFEFFFLAAAAGFFMTKDGKNASIALIAMVMIFNVVLYCFRQQLKIAIAIIDAAADFLAATKRLILVSFVWFLFMVVVVAIVMVGLMGVGFILAVAEAEWKKTNNKLPDFKIPKETYKTDPNLSAAQNKGGILCLLMLVPAAWFLRFLQDQVVFITMVGASSYYFTSDSQREGQG